VNRRVPTRPAMSDLAAAPVAGESGPLPSGYLQYVSAPRLQPGQIGGTERRRL
jgi:hypothetical protein